jgi:hypothetical protein
MFGCLRYLINLVFWALMACIVLLIVIALIV